MVLGAAGSGKSTNCCGWPRSWHDEVAVIGLTGCVAVALIPPHGDARDTANRIPGRTGRASAVWTAVLAAGVLPVADVAGVPADGPLDAAVGGLLVAVLGSAVSVSTGVALATVLAPPVRRVGLAWTVRLRPFLRESARHGLVTATDDGFRFLHVLLRDHIAQIDVLDGRPSEPVPALAARERETALARLDSLLAAQPQLKVWIAPRLREEGGDEPLTGTGPPNERSPPPAGR